MDDPALLRYSRHLLLNEIGVEGQERIGRTKVLVVGAGGIGSPASMYLVAAGIGRLVLLDDDSVDLTNLQRQIAHTTQRIGQNKARSAAASLQALNPTVPIDARPVRGVEPFLSEVLAQVDIALDCSDNRATRYALNRACLAARKPLVLAAASGFDGQLAVFDFRDVDTPCYACLFPEAAGGEDDNCATMGVFAPLTGIMGSMQAAETLRLICRFGPPPNGELLALDARSMELRRLRFARDPQCAVCSMRPK
jgi:molybdopterin/thiamine biosynthesis adenylyltransferase